MTRSNKVLVVGGANFDETFTVPRVSRPGESILSHGYSKAIGGKGLNQAVTLARAGAAVDMAAHIGYDGQPLVDALEKAGVGIQHMKKIETIPTGRAIIQLETVNRDNSIVFFPGANHHLCNPAPNDFSPYSLLVLQNEIPLKYTKAALGNAKAQGLTTMFNPSPMLGHEPFPWRLVDYLVVNASELDRTLESISSGALDSTTSLEARMDVLLSHYPGMTIMVTLGPDGVALLNQDYRLRLPAGMLSSVVKDTTGAGDTALGYFANFISRTKGKIGKEVMHDILAISQQAATMSVQRYGAMDAVPTLAEVKASTREGFAWPSWV